MLIALDNLLTPVKTDDHAEEELNAECDELTDLNNFPNAGHENLELLFNPML